MKKTFILHISIILIYTGGLFLSGTGYAASEKKMLSLSANEVKLIAIENNLDVKLAQLDSRIKGTELSYRQGIFDTFLNAKVDYTSDKRKRSSTIYGSRTLVNNYDIGLEKRLRSGTDVSIDFTNKREWTDSSFVSNNPYHESQVELSLRQPVLKNSFGIIDRGEIDIIREDIKNAALYSYINIEAAVVSAEKSYWALVLAREEYMIRKEMLKKAIRLFNQYRYKLKMGMVETGDVLASEANMHSREADLRTAYNNILSAEALLRLELNIGGDVRIRPVERLRKIEFNASFEDCLKKAFKNRRDYLASRNNLKSRDINLRLKSNSRFPQIDIVASFATNGISRKYYRAVEDIAEDSNPEYYAGIEFNLPLENRQAKSDYEKAQLEKIKSLIETQKTERQIILDVDESYRKLKLAEKNLITMKRIENLQRGKLTQGERRFRYGRSSSDMLIRYQEDLLNAILAKKRAYYDYLTAIIDLKDSEDSYLRSAGLE